MILGRDYEESFILRFNRDTQLNVHQSRCQYKEATIISGEMTMVLLIVLAAASVCLLLYLVCRMHRAAATRNYAATAGSFGVSNRFVVKVDMVYVLYLEKNQKRRQPKNFSCR